MCGNFFFLHSLLRAATVQVGGVTDCQDHRTSEIEAGGSTRRKRQIRVYCLRPKFKGTHVLHLRLGTTRVRGLSRHGWCDSCKSHVKLEACSKRGLDRDLVVTCLLLAMGSFESLSARRRITGLTC